MLYHKHILFFRKYQRVFNLIIPYTLISYYFDPEFGVSEDLCV